MRSKTLISKTGYSELGYKERREIRKFIEDFEAIPFQDRKEHFKENNPGDNFDNKLIVEKCLWCDK